MFTLFKGKPSAPDSQDGLSAAQAIGAEAAMAKYRRGDTEDGEKLLLKHGLTFDAAAAYLASLRTEDVATEPATPAPAPVNTDGAGELKVNVPHEYTDTIEQRAKLIAWLWAQNGEGWQIESFDKEKMKVVAVRGKRPNMRPGAAVYPLESRATASNGDLSATTHGAFGRTMLSYDFALGTAVTAKLPPATVEIREWLLQKNPKQKSWELELLPLFGVQDGEGVLERVIITRADQPMDRMKAMAYWMEVARTVVGHSGWTVEMDDRTGRVELISGKIRKLPRVVPGQDFLPREIDTENWSSFPIGRNSTGETVCVDLQAGPHSLVVGGTGSGKSVACRGIILNSLAHGFEVMIFDPQKEAAGLLGIKPWTKGIFIKSVEEAAAGLDAIYAEVRRRIGLITAVEGENWMDLPRGTVKPWLVLLDEYSALITPDDKPIGVDSKHELMLEWQADAGARAKIRSNVGKIAKQARSVGIHLVIATQRPDAADLGGNVRENLGTILQLVVPSKPPSPEAMGMVFPKAFAASAMEELSLLNDGRSKGFALSYLEGGGVQGFRVGLVEKDDMAVYAEEMGIPLGVPLELAEAEPAAYTTIDPKPAWEIEPAEEEVVVELGEMEMQWGDLEIASDSESESEPKHEEPAPAAAPTWGPLPEVEDDEDPFATSAPVVKVPRPADPDEDDPFAAPVRKSAISQVDDFVW
ncbi:FtsK/SpoIIIE domain-containing protein [Pseudarthrobacter phenanthrenivorans]|uniref:FtsK domain-containing protein n=1 Tax=Pseudarthrobacter phenanthrenivorans TaxID=361575 RepID=A0A0B4D5V6_PSEPS|nr:FtsK/SpoIIIE domain-containing protein [Pseudarthrobacter phenanthrenivorans]KIC68729.1 hypothetical protein RM50_04560 [Pseudarthrobacter phenanthrenivorans]